MNIPIAFREIVAGLLISLFAYAFFMNPHNEAIIGALLTGFATAYGFYLGGSKVGSDTAERNATTLSDQARGPQPVTIEQPSDKPVPVEAQ